MILTRYLTKEVFKSQIAILFILLLIFFSQQLVRVLGSAANGKVPADLVFSLLGLGMPTMAQLMLPLCLFIAILLTFGRLYAESEITVMRALEYTYFVSSGFSPSLAHGNSSSEQPFGNPL